MAGQLCCRRENCSSHVQLCCNFDTGTENDSQIRHKDDKLSITQSVGMDKAATNCETREAMTAASKQLCSRRCHKLDEVEVTILNALEPEKPNMHFVIFPLCGA